MIIELANSQYDNKIQIDEYNGKWSLTLGWTPKDGGFAPAMCTRTFGRKGDVKTPVRIPLGDSREEAAANLRLMLGEIEGGTGDDVPF